MPDAITEKKLFAMLGNPADVVRELAEFEHSARLLSSEHAHMLEQYDGQWIGVYQGRVVASGKTMKDIMEQAREKHLPTQSMIVRRIEKNQRTLIL